MNSLVSKTYVEIPNVTVSFLLTDFEMDQEVPSAEEDTVEMQALRVLWVPAVGVGRTVGRVREETWDVFSNTTTTTFVGTVDDRKWHEYGIRSAHGRGPKEG